MVVPFRSGEEEEAQDEVHRDEADADAEELALVEAALGPPYVSRSDGPDAPDEQDREHDADQDGRHRGRRDAAVGLKCRDLGAVHGLASAVVGDGSTARSVR